VGPQRQLVRWRLFLMACSELFAFAGGDEWLGSQYLFSKRTPQ
jgi:cyclopropane-fatty-acyl-phospholipid synthase